MKYQTRCSQFSIGLILILITGNLCHGLDNLFYHNTILSSGERKNDLVVAAGLIDRTVAVSVSLYFAAMTYSETFFWLDSAYFIYIYTHTHTPQCFSQRSFICAAYRQNMVFIGMFSCIALRPWLSFITSSHVKIQSCVKFVGIDLKPHKEPCLFGPVCIVGASSVVFQKGPKTGSLKSNLINSRIGSSSSMP